MELVVLVSIIALLEYIWLSFQVGVARSKYRIKAPATSGHPVFERVYRVQQNTLEQLVIFLPALLLFTWMAENRNWPGHEIAAALGVVWIIGRGIYARAYVQDPASRAVGFIIGQASSLVLLLGALVLVLLSVI